jgi:hypothetical protein
MSDPTVGIPGVRDPTVGMLDLTDYTLHRCGNVNMTTACGVKLDNLMVGPFKAVSQRADFRCPDPACFGR